MVGSIKRHATEGKRKQSQLQITAFHTPPWCNTRSVRQVKDEKKRNSGGRCNSQLPKIHLVDAHRGQSGRGGICHPIILPTHLAGLGVRRRGQREECASWEPAQVKHLG